MQTLPFTSPMMYTRLHLFIELALRRIAAREYLILGKLIQLNRDYHIKITLAPILHFLYGNHLCKQLFNCQN